MTVVRYTPASKGMWVVIARQGQLLVVDRRSGGDLLDGLWQATEPSNGVQAVLDELTRGGISRAPAFALATWSDDFGAAESLLGLIVRGDLSVVAHTDAGPIEIDGRGVSTWNERALAGVTGLEVRTEAARDGRGTGDAELRIESGMAWVAHVQVGAMSTVRAEGPAAAAPPARVSTASASSAKTPAPRTPPIPDKAAEDASIPSETTKSDFTIPGVASDEAPGEIGAPAAGGESGYDYLFGETIARTVEDAAVRAAGTDPESEMGSSRVEQDGDHDGKTAIGLDRAARQAARRARAQKAAGPLLPAGPRLFIDLSSGTSEELTQPILIGRAPSVSKVSGGNLPRLVTITGTDQDISRNHVQVAVEGGTVVVTDLHSRNGTMIVLPGRPPQQLRAGEPTAVIVGTVVDLGAGVTFTVREG